MRICGFLSARATLVRVLVAVLVAIAIVASICEYAIGASDVFANVAWTSSGLAALVASASAFCRGRGAVRRAWGYLLAATASWVIGQLFWIAYSIGSLPPSPNVADVAWYGFAVLAGFGVYHLSGLPRQIAGIEALPLVAASGTLVCALFEKSIETSQLSKWAEYATVAYPVLYVAVTVVLLQTMIGGGRPLLRERSVLLVLGAVALESLGFVVWAPKLLAGEYVTGGWVDVTWTVGLLVLSLGALIAPAEPRPVRHSTARSAFLPGLAFFGLIGTLVVFTLADENLEARLQLQVGIFLVGTLVLVRNTVLARAARRSAVEMQVAQDRYRALVEGIPLITYMDNVVDGACLYISPQVEDLLGYPTLEWTSDHQAVFDRALHPDDRDAVRRAATHSHETGCRFEMEYRLVGRDGRVVWVRDESVVVRDVAGMPAYVQGFWLDITGRKELEAQLRQSQKMEAVGRLAGGIAHDFNNLLTAISGYTSFALGRLNGHDSSLREDLVEVEKAAQRASELTQQLLAFSRRQVLTPQVLDLNAVVRDTRALLERLIGEDVAIVVRLDPRLAPVKADPGQIQQVLVNLAVNARDAMPNGGTLTLQTVATPASSVLVVSDTGTGMDERTRARIFEPFFTTKPAGAGTGLGLATVDGIVEQSGGSVELESELGHGTTFRLSFPVTGEALTAPLEAAPSRAAGTTARILLVEDDPTVRTLVRRMLELDGHEVVEAPTPDEALRRSAGGCDCDIVVTDVVMPGMSGRDLADRLRLESPELKVLFTSGYAGETFIDRKVLEPGMPFLEKPFTADELKHALADVLRS